MQVAKAHNLRLLGLSSFATGILFVLASKMEFLLPVLLSARSSLDIFHEVSFSFSWVSKVNPASMLALFIITGGLIYILAYIRKRKLHLDTISKMLVFWQASLLFWAVLAPFNVPHSGSVVIREWVRSFTILIVYFLVFNYVTRENYRRYVRYLFISLVAPMTIGFYQIVTKSAVADRVYGTLPGSNAFGLYLVLFINLTLWRYLASKRKIFWGLLLALELILLLRTFSMASIMLLFFSIFLWLLRVRKSIWVMLAIVLVFTAFPYIRTRIYNRVEGKISRLEAVLEGSKEERRIGKRFVIWYGLIDKWKERPLLGYGLSTVAMVNPTLVFPGKIYPLGYPKDVHPVPAAAHNDYLRYLVELGVIGLPLYLFFLTMVGRRLLAIYKLAKTDETRNLAYAVFVVFVAYIIGSSVQNYAGATAFHFYFWTSAAILSKLVMQEQKRDE